MKRYTCPNGLRIVLEKNDRVRSISMGIWVGTGSRYEIGKQNGMAHFIEHMLFKGTKSRSARDIAEAFDSIGGQVNAMTAKEYTCYYAKVVDTHARHALDVLTDMFFHSTFDEIEMGKEKGVVKEEISMYDDTPDDLVHELLSKATYQDHPLAAPILGTEKTIDGFTKANLFDYMSSNYHGGNTVVSIVGNIDDELIAHIESLFEMLPKAQPQPQLEKPIFYPSIETKAKETEQAHFCLNYEGFASNDSRLYALILLNNALGGSMSSRLFQEIREERGLAYSVFSFHTSYIDSGSVTIYVGSKESQLEEVNKVIQDTLKDVSENGITEKELANGKEQLKGSLLLSLESTSSRMMRLGKNELLLGEHKTIEETTAYIDAVTLEDIIDVAKAILTTKPAMSLVSTKGELPASFIN